MKNVALTLLRERTVQTILVRGRKHLILAMSFPFWTQTSTKVVDGRKPPRPVKLTQDPTRKNGASRRKGKSATTALGREPREDAAAATNIAKIQRSRLGNCKLYLTPCLTRDL